MSNYGNTTQQAYNYEQYSIIAVYTGLYNAVWKLFSDSNVFINQELISTWSLELHSNKVTTITADMLIYNVVGYHNTLYVE